MEEEMLDEIFADLAADLVDLSDDEIKDRILKYGLSPEDMKEVFDTVKAVQAAEATADNNPDPLSLENVDALADANTAAKSMANEDQTDVKVIEEDKDSDGDDDKVTVEKQEPEDDMTLTDEERAIINSIGSEGSEEPDEGTEESDNSSETEDKPHEEPKFKNKTNQIAKYLGENRLGGM